jgi:hypothetical protein
MTIEANGSREARWHHGKRGNCWRARGCVQPDQWPGSDAGAVHACRRVRRKAESVATIIHTKQQRHEADAVETCEHRKLLNSQVARQPIDTSRSWHVLRWIRYPQRVCQRVRGRKGAVNKGISRRWRASTIEQGAPECRTCVQTDRISISVRVQIDDAPACCHLFMSDRGARPSNAAQCRYVA